MEYCMSNWEILFWFGDLIIYPLIIITFINSLLKYSDRFIDYDK